MASLGIQVCSGLAKYYKARQSYGKDAEAVATTIEDLLGQFEEIKDTLESVGTIDHGGKVLQRANDIVVKCSQDVELLK